MFKIVNCQLVRLKNSFNHSKRWKPLACQLSTVLYKSVIKEAGDERYLPLLFHLFIPRIEWVATAATSVGVVPPGVEIAGAPSVVSRVSPSAPPPLPLCSSAPTLLLLLGLWRSVRCSPQWWQHPVEIENWLFYLQFHDTSYTWKYSWIWSENKCFSKMYK